MTPAQLPGADVAPGAQPGWWQDRVTCRPQPLTRQSCRKRSDAAFAVWTAETPRLGPGASLPGRQSSGGQGRLGCRAPDAPSWLAPWGEARAFSPCIWLRSAHLGVLRLQKFQGGQGPVGDVGMSPLGPPPCCLDQPLAEDPGPADEAPEGPCPSSHILRCRVRRQKPRRGRRPQGGTWPGSQGGRAGPQGVWPRPQDPRVCTEHAASCILRTRGQGQLGTPLRWWPPGALIPRVWAPAGGRTPGTAAQPPSSGRGLVCKLDTRRGAEASALAQLTGSRAQPTRGL